MKSLSADNMGHARHEVRKRWSVTIKRTVLLEHLSGRLDRVDDDDVLPKYLDMDEVGICNHLSGSYARKKDIADELYLRLHSMYARSGDFCGTTPRCPMIG